MEIEIVCKLYLDCVNMQTQKEYEFAMLFNNPVKMFDPLSVHCN